MLSFILLCLAVFVICIPPPAPWARWLATALTLLALIIFCLGHRADHIVWMS
jgi:hypothetical protein